MAEWEPVEVPVRAGRGWERVEFEDEEGLAGRKVSRLSSLVSAAAKSSTVADALPFFLLISVVLKSTVFPEVCPSSRVLTRLTGPD